MKIFMVNPPVVEYYSEYSLFDIQNKDYYLPNLQLFIPKLIIKNIIEVDEVPDDLAPGKYCYLADIGFYLNADWVEPEPTTDDIDNVETVLTVLEKELRIEETNE